VIKNNLDPCEPDVNSYGTHESYTSWVPAELAGPQLIPHLVTRTLYCGSGGLTGHADGQGFELSQRARHLLNSEGDDTTCNRAIFSTRLRNDTDGGGDWMRIHLIGKDSQRAPFGTYLTYATTGLLIEMINRGLEVGKGLALATPVESLRAISLDPWGRRTIELLDGRKMKAVEVQALYLEECEKALQAGHLPEWAREAIRHWREVLTELERNPLRLADRLDPYCKLLLYEREVTRAGLLWTDLATALGKLNTLRSGYAEEVIRAVLREDDSALAEEQRQSLADARAELGGPAPAFLERLRFASWLQALDFNYHEVGGLYDRLHDTGRMVDVILTPEQIVEASRVPPPGGRAAVRGEWVRAHRDAGWRAAWQYVWQDTSGLCVDLRNPFTGARREVQLKLPKDTNPWHIDVMDLLSAPQQPEEPPTTISA
jgi:hypothetical protein